MSKFANTGATPAVTSPVHTTGVQVPTHEGGAGYARDAKSALFLLAVSNLVGEDTFYEQAADRDSRFVRLAQEVTAADPAWVATFVPYLRGTIQMRSAALVLAAEYVKAGGPGGRAVIASALQRADEPAEMLAYWYQVHGKRVPQPVKRGIADAVSRLYTERSALKYNGGRRAWHMADVLELAHPTPRNAEQSALFHWLLDRRHGRESVPESLPLIAETMRLDAVPVEDRRALLTSGSVHMNWERLSGWLRGAMDAQAWESVIPEMGYMALLRNLRNFEDADVSDGVLQAVATRLADAEEVRASRQLPFRFYSAYKQLRSERFSYPLEQALGHAVRNIPHFDGSTVIYVDCSASMTDRLSKRSAVSRFEVAGLFGLALAKRCEQVRLFAYGIEYREIDTQGPILRTMQEFRNMGGTLTWQTVQSTYRDEDRIIILTDEQAFPYESHGRVYGVGQEGTDGHGLFYEKVRQLPARTYTFNLAGYAPAHNEQGIGRSVCLGGLSDAGFAIMEAIERVQDAGWPWE